MDQQVPLFARITEMQVCLDPWSRLAIAVLLEVDLDTGAS